MRPATIAKFCAPGESLLSHGHGMRATGVEATATRWANKAGNFTTSRDVSKPLVVVSSEAGRVWRCRDQQLRIGMPGLLDHLVTWSSFHHLPGVHHQGILCKITSAGNIMSDEKQSQPLFIF